MYSRIAGTGSLPASSGSQIRAASRQPSDSGIQAFSISRTRRGKSVRTRKPEKSRCPIIKRMPAQATRFGKPLPPGGTIGVPAPATSYHNRSEILRGVEWWEAKGYRVKLSQGIYARDDWVAGDPELRARDLMAMFADPEVDVVQCARGGYGSAQLVPQLDFDVVAANPKPFVGYSDITALHVALRRRAGLATFYGPGLHGVGDHETTAFTKDRLLEVLTGDGTGPVPRDPDDPYVRAIRGGKVTA